MLIVNEDEYWEAVRERMENPPTTLLDEDPEAGTIWLDEFPEEIEKRVTSGAADTTELMDIVEEYTGRCPLWAKFNGDLAIDYQLSVVSE